MDVLLAGDEQGTAALLSALRERGIEATRFDKPEGLAKTMVALEEILEREAPLLALGVGAGDESLALAITAPKLGVPFAAWLDDGAVSQPDERRILETLSGDSAIVGTDVVEAAERIATRFRGSPGPGLNSRQ